MVGKSKRLLVCFIVLTIGVLMLPPESSAVSTGQIKGQIVNKDNGEPIIGASVLVVGTIRGAQTDIDGRFAILRMDPGIYMLKISHLDYTTVEVTDVEVKIDETFEVNQEMTRKVTDLDETITVKGTHDILDKFVTESRITISQESIKQRPVQTVDALLEQVAGVQTTAEGEVFVRGGRAGEVAYIVDGVPITDPLGGQGGVGANLSLVSGSIQDIQIIKDGFDPEYGNALSGIVNIRSQTGSKDNTRFNMQYITDDFGSDVLNKYSRNFDYVRMSLSGPDPILSEKILPSLGMNFLRDQEFTYFIYFDMDKDDGFYQMQDFNTPYTQREWPVFNIFGIDVPERLWNRYTFQGNFKFRPRQNLRFVASYKKWYVKRTLFNSDYWDYRYSNLTAPVYTNDRTSMSLEVTQSVTKDMNYEVILSMTELETSLAPGDPDNPGKVLEPDEFLLESQYETFDDNNDNGVYDPPEPLINLFPDTASGYSGPQYTLGEYFSYDNIQGGGSIPSNFRFNDNGIIDSLEGEPFLDLNGNGVWDRGDILYDKNGNGVLDAARKPVQGASEEEPYIDGDSILGEPFTDLNANNVYDEGVDMWTVSVDESINQDLNHNGRYDGPDMESWEPGIPFEDRNGNGIYDASNSNYDIGEPFRDINGNGKWDGGGTSQVFLDPGTYDQTATWQRREARTLRSEVKITRQIGRHELKAGFAAQRDELVFQDIQQPYREYTGRPDSTAAYSTRGAFRDFYEYAPMQGTVYFRDKIEYGSMIASLGLRWDFFLQDTDELANTLEEDDRGGLIAGDRQKFSPRMGFSYPISDKAKVYFNYGHFFQLPDLVRMYARNTSSVDADAVVGNPNLDYMKTIQYSFGVKYAMSESYSLDIQGYFKDEFDKVGSKRVKEGYVYRQRYINGDYGRSRGFELTLEKRGGGYVNGQVSYTYAFAYGKASQTNDRYLDEFYLSREPLSESPLNNDIRHSFKGAVTIYMPGTVKPRLFGIPIPNGWSLSVETIIESGRPFTPTAIYPNITTTVGEEIETNSLRYPSTAYFDARFSKEFELAGLDWNFILWVENIFNSRNVVSVFSSTGRPDTDQNDGTFVRAGSDYDQNPYHWGYGRQIRLGLELNI